MTISEIHQRIEAYSVNKKDSFKEKLTLAYYTGLFQRVENPKALLDEDIENIDEVEQTDEDMFNTLKRMMQKGG